MLYFGEQNITNRRDNNIPRDIYENMYKFGIIKGKNTCYKRVIAVDKNKPISEKFIGDFENLKYLVEYFFINCEFAIHEN